jgi:hypothetical protein
MKWYYQKNLPPSTRLCIVVMLFLEICQAISLLGMFLSFTSGLIMFCCCLALNLILRALCKKYAGIEV